MLTLPSADRLRIGLALACSVLLHVLAVSPWRPFVDDNAGFQQPHLSAHLRPSVAATEKVAERSAERSKPGRPRTEPAVKAGKSATSRSLGDGNSSSRSAAPDERPVAEEKHAEEASQIEQPKPPEYPEEAVRRRLEGCVLASVTVNQAGEVAAVRVIASDHPGVFDQSIADSQKTAHYLPARINGEAVESRVLTVAAFVLEKGRRLNCALRFADEAARQVGAGVQ